MLTVKKIGLSGNTIKLLALLFMTIDHVGLVIFPKVFWLRKVGRLAFPLFAYMIAEGCLYSKHKYKRLLTIFILGVLFQIVYTMYSREWFLNIFLTFTLSISIISLIDLVKNKKVWWAYLFLCIAIILILVITIALPKIINTFDIDYGIFGVVLPIAIYLFKNKWLKLLMVISFAVIFTFTDGEIYLYSALSVIILYLYNGKRGKYNIKYLFYLYYPLHILIIYAISFFVNYVI